MKKLAVVVGIVVAAVVAVGVIGFVVSRGRQPKPGTVLDEARSVGRTPESMPAADEDYFHDMDGAVALTPEEVKGRNSWIVWTGGNDRFWDVISKRATGSLDFIKTLSS